MANLAKSLLTAASALGPGTGVDLTAFYRGVTFQVIPSADMACVIQFDGSLDNVNWFSLGQKVGPGKFSRDGHVSQYVRANIIALASGTVTVLCASA